MIHSLCVVFVPVVNLDEYDASSLALRSLLNTWKESAIQSPQLANRMCGIGRLLCLLYRIIIWNVTAYAGKWNQLKVRSQSKIWSFEKYRNIFQSLFILERRSLQFHEQLNNWWISFDLGHVAVVSHALSWRVPMKLLCGVWCANTSCAVCTKISIIWQMPWSCMYMQIVLFKQVAL